MCATNGKGLLHETVSLNYKLFVGSTLLTYLLCICVENFKLIMHCEHVLQEIFSFLS